MYSLRDKIKEVCCFIQLKKSAPKSYHKNVNGFLRSGSVCRQPVLKWLTIKVIVFNYCSIFTSFVLHLWFFLLKLCSSTINFLILKQMRWQSLSLNKVFFWLFSSATYVTDTSGSMITSRENFTLPRNNISIMNEHTSAFAVQNK